MYNKFTTGLASLLLVAGSSAIADPFILETFTDYPDNALVSASPAGPAVGLVGEWYLDTDSDFFVNRTETDLDSGTGKAVYDRPAFDNGTREAYRLTSDDHILFDEDGDVFYASFLIQPELASGYMFFTLILDRLDDGGQQEVSFGIKGGRFHIGSDGVQSEVSGGTVTVNEALVVLKVVYSASGNDVVTLWVDPVNELSDPVIDSIPVDFLNPGGGKITAVTIRGEQMLGRPAFFDDLRVGFQFEDVTNDMQAPVLSRDIGMNGQFYDDSNPGHGFDFNVHQAGFTMFYYGHSSNGERLWLVSETISENLEFGQPYELEMFEVINGEFGLPVHNETTWGTITITLSDCDSGHASFNGLDGNLEMDFIRLTSLPGIDCQY